LKSWRRRWSVVAQGWFCEYPDHEGTRYVLSPMDRFSKRVTFVRADGKQRLNEKVIPGGRICRACIAKEEAKGIDPNQGALL